MRKIKLNKKKTLITSTLATLTLIPVVAVSSVACANQDPKPETTPEQLLNSALSASNISAPEQNTTLVNTIDSNSLKNIIKGLNFQNLKNIDWNNVSFEIISSNKTSGTITYKILYKNKAIENDKQYSIGGFKKETNSDTNSPATNQLKITVSSSTLLNDKTDTITASINTDTTTNIKWFYGENGTSTTTTNLKEIKSLTSNTALLNSGLFGNTTSVYLYAKVNNKLISLKEPITIVSVPAKTEITLSLDKTSSPDSTPITATANTKTVKNGTWTYQWFLGTSATDKKVVSGQTSKTLQITNKLAGTNNKVWVEATLTINGKTVKYSPEPQTFNFTQNISTIINSLQNQSTQINNTTIKPMAAQTASASSFKDSTGKIIPVSNTDLSQSKSLLDFLKTKLTQTITLEIIKEQEKKLLSEAVQKLGSENVLIHNKLTIDPTLLTVSGNIFLRLKNTSANAVSLQNFTNTEKPTLNIGSKSTLYLAFEFKNSKLVPHVQEKTTTPTTPTPPAVATLAASTSPSTSPDGTTTTPSKPTKTYELGFSVNNVLIKEQINEEKVTQKNISQFNLESSFNVLNAEVTNVSSNSNVDFYNPGTLVTEFESKVTDADINKALTDHLNNEVTKFTNLKQTVVSSLKIVELITGEYIPQGATWTKGTSPKVYQILQNLGAILGPMLKGTNPELGNFLQEILSNKSGNEIKNSEAYKIYVGKLGSIGGSLSMIFSGSKNPWTWFAQAGSFTFGLYNTGIKTALRSLPNSVTNPQMKLVLKSLVDFFINDFEKELISTSGTNYNWFKGNLFEAITSTNTINKLLSLVEPTGQLRTIIPASYTKYVDILIELIKTRTAQPNFQKNLQAAIKSLLSVTVTGQTTPMPLSDYLSTNLVITDTGSISQATKTGITYNKNIEFKFVKGATLDLQPIKTLIGSYKVQELSNTLKTKLNIDISKTINDFGKILKMDLNTVDITGLIPDSFSITGGESITYNLSANNQKPIIEFNTITKQLEYKIPVVNNVYFNLNKTANDLFDSVLQKVILIMPDAWKQTVQDFSQVIKNIIKNYAGGDINQNNGLISSVVSWVNVNIANNQPITDFDSDSVNINSVVNVKAPSSTIKKLIRKEFAASMKNNSSLNLSQQTKDTIINNYLNYDKTELGTPEIIVTAYYKPITSISSLLSKQELSYEINVYFAKPIVKNTPTGEQEISHVIKINI